MGRGKKKSGAGRNPRRLGRGGQAAATRGNTRAAPNNQVVRRRPPQCRLFFLYQHLVLRCFNYLDNDGRKSAFAVMGWSMENHERRKAMMRKRQLELEAKEKAKEEEERKIANEKQVKDTEEAKQSNSTESPEKQNVKFMDQLTMCQEVASLNVSGENERPGNKESQQGPTSEKGEVLRTNGTESVVTESSDAPSGGAMKEILPPLFAPIDPDTLLARLNTRRLCKRVAHYKNKQRKKRENDATELASIDTADGKVGHSVIEMFDKELKETIELDRLYPKNVTIAEMADMEWDNLLETATMRNGGEEIPYDPIPTKHELLLFSPCPRAVAVLASYPRSGNSLMRTLYEHTTLRVTGSDMQGGLAKHDLVGEMAVGTNKVQFVKTHFPERRGTPPFLASRVVLLVRNPYDAIESFFNLMMTGTHTTSVTEEVREKTQKIWEEFVLKEARVWKRFHEYWFNQDIPILLVRYEDLIRKPDKVTGRVIQFVLEIQRMGSFFDERIDRCVREQQEIHRLGSYKPRSGGIGKSMSMYSPELRKKMEDEDFMAVMESLGYAEMMNSPPDQWAKLPPLADYGIEYLVSSFVPEGENTVALNKGELARTEAEVTHWNKVKAELGIGNEPCNCESCRLSSRR